MQVEELRLAVEECTQRRDNNLCLYCGGTEHFLHGCLVRLRNSGFKGEVTLGKDASSQRLTLVPSDASLEVSAYVDSHQENSVHLLHQ